MAWIDQSGVPFMPCRAGTAVGLLGTWAKVPRSMVGYLGRWVLGYWGKVMVVFRWWPDLVVVVEG